MKSIILHVLCEGQTEERFLKEVLSPYLQPFGIYPKAALLVTSRKKSKKGGMLSYAQAKGDLTRLINGSKDNDSERHIFTTMFDYYALPDDFPGYEEALRLPDPRERVRVIESRLSEDIGNRSFIPYIQLHEFEALLFADIESLVSEYPKAARQIANLRKETDTVGDPEMINKSPHTAPSKRIIKALGQTYNYNKVKSGPAVTKAIGMPALMQRCRHFGEWVMQLQSAVSLP